MKKTFRLLCVLCVASVVLSSCLNNDSDTTSISYPDMAITSFTLGTLNRYQHLTSSYSGLDTVVKVTYSGSLYPMTIDHLQQRIYNQTPLPVGTDAAHVICTIGTKNNGVVYLKRPTSDSLFYHQSTDSVDLTQPRVFRVFSIDGQGSRDYTVTLNVSQTTGTTFAWLRTDSIGLVDGFADMRLVAVGDTVRLMPRSAVVMGGSVYGPFEGKTLLGAASHELFALDADGQLVRSADRGQSWQAEELDDKPALLPKDNVAMTSWPYEPADSTDYVLMAGNDPDNDQAMTLWRKISPYGGQSRWVLMVQDDVNRQRLPRLEQLSLTRFDGTVLAMGGRTKTIYQSRDQGITWQQPSGYALPARLGGTAALMAASGNGLLWVVTDNGEVWQGTLR